MISFDPSFYAARALWAYAKRLRRPIQCDVRLTRIGVPLSGRPVIDGMVVDERQERAVAVVAHSLTEKETRHLVERHSSLGFRSLTILAPEFESSRDVSSASAELLPFRPAVNALPPDHPSRWQTLRPAVAQWLEKGGIQFHCATAEPMPGIEGSGAPFPRIDGDIRSLEGLRRGLELQLLADLTPVRIVWSPFRSARPCDGRGPIDAAAILERTYVNDVDGRFVHRAMFPCTIAPDTGLCADCIELSRRHTLRLVARLRGLGFSPEVFFGGRRGFHVYVFDPAAHEATPGFASAMGGAKAPALAAQRVPMLPFPGSLDGYTMRPLVAVDDAKSFRVEDAAALGDP